MKIRTCGQLIKYLEQIPEERWRGFRFKDEEGRCCFMGHLGGISVTDEKTMDLGKKVVKLFPNTRGSYHHIYKWPYAVVDANNTAPEGKIKETVLELLKQNRTNRFLLRPITV